VLRLLLKLTYPANTNEQEPVKFFVRNLHHDRDMERARGNCLRVFFLERAALRRAHVHEHNSGYYLPVLLCESGSGVLWHCMHSVSVRDAMCARESLVFVFELGE
jgi:hypothetical protein